MASLVQSRIDRIRADHRSGAVALTHRAGDVLCLLAREQARSEREFRKRLAKVCRALVESQPSMAPILNLAKFVLVGTDEIFDLAELKTGVKSSVRNFLERMEVDGQATSNTAANLIQDGMTVMTHSASQTVMSALLRAAVLGRRVRVITTESRPVLEGVVLAENLGKAGMPVTLIVDACMLQCLPEADLVLVGADAVTREVVVNKAGTSALALAAGKLEKRMYALAGPEKFLPPGYRLPEEKPKDPREVLRRRLKNVAVRNLYFDQTPLAWLAGVVSGDQMLNATRIRQRLKSMQLHAALWQAPIPSRDRQGAVESTLP